MSTAPAATPENAGKEATRIAARAFVRRVLDKDVQYRPIHLDENGLVELLTEFREEEKF
jgi:hypothetical protein